jgi:hypothetical protein
MTMAKMIAVKAADPEIQVPREDNSRRYIGGEPALVERSTYYIRRIAHGELVELNEADTAKLAAELEKKAQLEADNEKKAVEEHKTKTEKAIADAKAAGEKAAAEKAAEKAKSDAAAAKANTKGKE